MISFRPAIRNQTPLMVGIAGPSRSGKTYSALRIAAGLAQGKPIVLIDTEARRGLQYADRFKYLHGDLTAPFSPARYTEAVQQAMLLEPAVIIVDSASHMHEGPGGVLEMHDRELDKRAGDDYKKRERLTFSAWIEPKHQVNLFVNTMLQLPVHFIFCFRAKDKIKIVKGEEPTQLGWTPIITDRFEYEMSFLLVLPEGSQGRPDFSAQSHGLRTPFEQFIKDGVQLDEQLGHRLAQWAEGNAEEKEHLRDVIAQRQEVMPVPFTPEQRKWKTAQEASRDLTELAEVWMAMPKHLHMPLDPIKNGMKEHFMRIVAEQADPPTEPPPEPEPEPQPPHPPEPEPKPKPEPEPEPEPERLLPNGKPRLKSRDPISMVQEAAARNSRQMGEDG